jgi:hypothetical protein
LLGRWTAPAITSNSAIPPTADDVAQEFEIAAAVAGRWLDGESVPEASAAVDRLSLAGREDDAPVLPPLWVREPPLRKREEFLFSDLLESVGEQSLEVGGPIERRSIRQSHDADVAADRHNRVELVERDQIRVVS